jgi:hypothetical protein
VLKDCKLATENEISTVGMSKAKKIGFHLTRQQ